MKFFMMPPGQPGSAQQMQCTCIDGRINILLGIEPFNDDGSFGLHVSLRHQKDRVLTETEIKAIGDKLFGRTPWKEENIPGMVHHHLWEICGGIIIAS